MLKVVKNYIKTKPRLYDAFNSMRPIDSGVGEWLNNFSRNRKKLVNFIQIGASDGLRWDPFRRFIIRDKWNGVFVEPLPNVFSILKRNYAHRRNQNLKFVNAAISIGDVDYIDIWSYSEQFCESLSLEDRLFYLRKSSLDRNHVEQSLKGYDNTESKIKCFRVKCISINALIREFCDKKGPSLILIDAEGHDDKIIRTIDFNSFSPEAILFESHNIGANKKKIDDFLVGKGYKISDLGGDSVAERK